MAAMTRARVSSRTISGALRTLDTVCRETLACLATVAIVTFDGIHPCLVGFIDQEGFDRSRGCASSLDRSSYRDVSNCLAVRAHCQVREVTSADAVGSPLPVNVAAAP